MTFVRHTKTALAFGLALQLVIATQTATTAQAQQMIGTDAAIARTAAEMDRAYLMDELGKDEIRDEMVRLGVSPDEAEARLAALSDAEIARMVRQVDQDKAGADGIVGALLTVFIILLVTDLLCFTRLFNFTRCVR